MTTDSSEPGSHPEEHLEVDFDEPATAAVRPTAPSRNGSREKVHPADEEWVPPMPEPARPEPRSSSRGAAVGRTLPFSLEAEEYLLSCCLLDGADVIARCLEAKITPDSFYDSKHGIIFEQLLILYNEKKPIDVSVVAEELKKAKKLDQVNGYAFLTQVSSRIPTTAQTGYFIEKVREQALLRELIRAGTRAVEECYNFSGEIDDFLSEQEARIRKVVEIGESGRAAEVANRAFKIDKQIPKPSPIYMMAGTVVSTPGNLTAIYSQPKTGKSALVGAMIAAAMTSPSLGYDTLQIAGPNYGKLALLHFDTEQSPYDWQQLIKSALKRVKMTEPPPWLMSYTLTGMPAHDCQRFIWAAMKRAKKLFGGIHSVLIDGIGDLVRNPNDEEECFPLVTELHGKAIEYETAIVSVLHMNPGSEIKGRGHLGSQLERKAESNLTLEKNDEEVTSVWSTRQRGKALTRDKAPSFRYNHDAGMHLSCSTPDKPTNSGRKENFTYSDYKNIFPTRQSMGLELGPLHKLLQQNKVISKETLHHCLKRWATEGAVEIIATEGRPMRYRCAV